jgi:hypothetical protein
MALLEKIQEQYELIEIPKEHQINIDRYAYSINNPRPSDEQIRERYGDSFPSIEKIALPFEYMYIFNLELNHTTCLLVDMMQYNTVSDEGYIKSGIEIRIVLRDKGNALLEIVIKLSKEEYYSFNKKEMRSNPFEIWYEIIFVYLNCNHKLIETDNALLAQQPIINFIN